MKKTYTKTGKGCRVTFTLPADFKARKACVLGEFNDWDPKANPLKKRKDGSFSTTISLDSGKEYRYRYLLDGKKWENDGEADKFMANEHGEEDSVIVL